MAVAYERLVETAPASGIAAKREESTDAALALALTAGEQDAPRLVWERYSPLVRRLVQRTLGPEHDVEDVVQDAFVCVFNRVHTLRDPAAFKAFVTSIAVLTTKYELRRRKIRRWVGLKHASNVPDLRVIQDGDDSREALTRFYRLLDRLRARDRTAFVLRFIEGMEAADVAAALGVSTPTARRSYTHAWQRISVLASRDAFLADYLASLNGRSGA
jgi:RNA polymerase sigma-70 factor, ECF subfamily